MDRSALAFVLGLPEKPLAQGIFLCTCGGTRVDLRGVPQRRRFVGRTEHERRAQARRSREGVPGMALMLEVKVLCGPW